MRIVVDALPLQVRSAGIAVYTDRLVRALATAHPDLDLVLFGMRAAGWVGAADARAPYPRGVRWVRSWRYPLITGMPLAGIPRLYTLDDVVAGSALYHATNYALPRSRQIPVVVTIHDLALLRYPELGTPALRRMVGSLRSVAQATWVIADSTATARDATELLGIRPEHVRVVHLGCDPSFAPVPDTPARAETLRRYGVMRPYVLHVGTIEPRKNLPTLVQAFARLCAARPSPQQLVLAGATGWGSAPLDDAIRASGIADRIVRAGAIAADDLPSLYSAADLFVYPSLYEGFGLPVLEAMACATPVLTSTAGSLPEIAGDAARCVDPRDIEALAGAMAVLLEDSAQRCLLTERGRIRAAQFTWERCARETFAVYEEIWRAAAGRRSEMAGTAG